MSTYDLAKRILQDAYPAEVFRSQPQTDWKGDFPLPGAVAIYYSEFGPFNVTIEAPGNPYFLPSLGQLWAQQDGYRYQKRLFGNRRLNGWDDDWLVVADEGADPFIYSRQKGNILFAYHGEGVWEPREMFDSLLEMAGCLAILGDIVARRTDIYVYDDDGNMMPKYRDEARQRIADMVQSPARADLLLERLGWE